MKASGTNLSITLTNDYENVFLYFGYEKNEIISQFQVDPDVLGKVFGLVLLVSIVVVVIFKKKPGLSLLITILSVSYNIYKWIESYF